MDMNIQQHEENEIELRNSFERPIYKLSVKLIDTYKYINKVINIRNIYFNEFIIYLIYYVYNYYYIKTKRYIMNQKLKN